jgi:hypothetical protein
MRIVLEAGPVPWRGIAVLLLSVAMAFVSLILTLAVGLVLLKALGME